MPTANDFDLAVSAVVLPGLQEDPPRAPAGAALLSATRILWSRGLVAPAITGIRLLDSLEEADADALYKLGCWLLHLGSPAEAKAVIERALRLAPEEPQLRLGYAHALFHLQEYSRAAAEFEALISLSPNLTSPPPMASAARRLAQGLRPEEIVASPLPGLPAGLSEMLQVRLLDGPAAACGRFPRPSGPVGERNLPLRRLETEYLLEQDKDEEALGLAETILRSFPFDGGTWYLKGIAARRLQDRETSHDAMTRAVFFGPLECRAWAGAGAGFMELRDMERAWKCYRVATYLDDANPNTWGDLAICQSHRGRPEDARDALDKAIELGAHTLANYLNRALTLIELGQAQQAQLDLFKALAVEPGHRRAGEVREVLEQFPPGDERFTFGSLSE